MNKYHISYWLVWVNSTVGLYSNESELHNGCVEGVERGEGRERVREKEVERKRKASRATMDDQW